ncbi:aldo/keto reductase [Bifidobacterium miconisargentati]|uniref:aldo/keto reductase n=1 Tax=Bifidobacterium miconisargentati TaxID=2834437 RepID=UPI001BDBEB4D|nr:aldo/keto reductase [Bifidobacterium miconisargentati]MBW3091039.1 aldo/keto reductase [Bifidobacterium miconisargentati]
MEYTKLGNSDVTVSRICHMWDCHTDMAEIMEGMNEAVKAGKARAIGISNCYAYQLAKINALAAGRLGQLEVRARTVVEMPGGVIVAVRMPRH